MKIAVNARFLLKDKLEGLGMFSHETLKRMTLQHPEHEFIFFFDRQFDDQFVYTRNIRPEVVFPPARHPLLWYWWFELSLPHYLKKHKADLFLSPDGYLSLRSEVVSLPVIHDLAFEHYPRDVPLTTSKYYRHFFPKYARKAKRIATVSNFSKRDIAQRYGIDKERIDVVFNGATDFFAPVEWSVQKRMREELTGGAPYFLYVGALHARKNIANLMRAFDLYRKKFDTNFKLVLIGRKAWETSEMEETYEKMNHKDQVIFTGRVSGKKLADYMGSAMCLTYISYFEGFGIPLVEAMACDVPVITSNRSSLPEVAGDAGMIVDPFNVDEIADAMGKMSKDEGFRNNLIARARIQRQKFSWQKTTDLLWESMMKAVNE